MGLSPVGYTSCQDCRGRGRKDNGAPCPNCEGTGIVAVYPCEADYQERTERRVPERRRFPRYLTNLPITLNLPERVVEGYCNQISEGGLRAFLREPVRMDSVVVLQFVVPGHATELRVKAVVRYHHGFEHGLEFLSISEAERLAVRQFCSELVSVS